MRIIAGRWRGHRIEAPPSSRTRPTTDRVREAWMSRMQAEIPDARVLDLFAGSGGLGLETLSRGARHATFVERAGGALGTLKRNIRKLGAEDMTTVVRGDALRHAEGLAADAFDIALADPPYDAGLVEPIVRAFERAGFARSLWIEHRVSEPLPALDDCDTRRYGDTLISRVGGTR